MNSNRIKAMNDKGINRIEYILLIMFIINSFLNIIFRNAIYYEKEIIRSLVITDWINLFTGIMFIVLKIKETVGKSHMIEFIIDGFFTFYFV